MNYRHIYHAGNFADVFKHSILVLLLEHLLRKDKPFCYVETHAGTALYDLSATAAQKTNEYLNGIGRLLSSLHLDKVSPKELAPYFKVVHTCNANTEALQFYPGSPTIARALLRPEDRMILMELHPEDAAKLKQAFYFDKQVAVHHTDGYQGLKAFLPPPIKRGLVLIDPCFEQKEEFTNIINGLQIALRKWSTGIYAVWYPIKNLAAVQNFLHDLKMMNFPMLLTEMTIKTMLANDEFVGCGMVIINPPWQFEQQLQKVVPWLWQRLAQGNQGGYKIAPFAMNFKKM